MSLSADETLHSHRVAQDPASGQGQMGNLHRTLQYTNRLLNRLRRGARVALPEARLRHLVGRAHTIPSQTRVEEQLCLYDEARSVLELGRLVEIGSYLGGSSIVLAEALRRWSQVSRHSRLYCIDTWENDAMTEGKWETKGLFLSNIAPWSDYITPVVGRSEDIQLPFDGECDVVFIDGDHSYEGARRDVDRFGPRVRDGGRLVMHDHQYYRSVTRVVGELLASGQWYVARAVQNIISLVPERGS